MRRRPAAYFFDTVTLSNFALVGRFGLLIERYGTRLQVTPEVLDEVTEGVMAGYDALHEIEDAVADGVVGRAGVLTAPADRQAYAELLRILGAGEASCIVHAAAHGGVVVSDDRTARLCCGERGIDVSGTLGILKACSVDGSITQDEADSILQAMIDAGYYSPVRRISDI